MSTSTTVRTAEQALAWLVANGICIADLARKHDIPRYAFYDVLRGKRVGRRGQAHKAAVLLGMKPDPKTVQ